MSNTTLRKTKDKVQATTVNVPTTDSSKSLPESQSGTLQTPVNVAPPQQQLKRYIKPNFFKYNAVEKEMISLLDGTETSTNIAKTLNLSPTTFRKYKALANILYPQQNLMTQEEKIFKEKRNKGLI